MTELFEESIIYRQPRWPVMLKLTGASLAVHITLLALLFYVPGVRDTFNIAALLSNTGYADRPYTRTEIGDDVQLVTVAGDKFRYPPGYFATEADWAQAQAQANVPSPAITPVTVQPEISPSPSPTPEPSPSPSPSPEASPAATANTTVADNSTPTEPKSPEQAEKELEKIATENKVVRPNENEINTLPLKEWLAESNQLKLKGELDLNSEVEILITANLNTDCKLSDPKIDRKTGDPRLIEVAKRMAAAIGDSRMLSFLRDPNKIKDQTTLRCDEMPLQLTIKLDQKEIVAKVESQADSPERAEQMARGYNGLLTIGQFTKRGKDEEVLYKNTKVTAEGKQIVVNFSMPRETASEMLKKQLPPAS
jgi:hypothetical protein